MHFQTCNKFVLVSENTNLTNVAEVGNNERIFYFYKPVIIASNRTRSIIFNLHKLWPSRYVYLNYIAPHHNLAQHRKTSLIGLVLNVLIIVEFFGLKCVVIQAQERQILFMKATKTIMFYSYFRGW